VVNRLVEPTGGEVLVDGRNVLAEDPTTLRRGIGYVIQQVGLFPHQTIGRNVATVPRLLGWPAARIAARIDELLALVGLDPSRMRDRYPSQLSGGERQRVGFARALAAEPPLLLMDEPFGAVDPIVRERLQDEFLRIQRHLGTTVMLVTHDIDEAIKLGDRVAVLRTGGQLVQYAAPDELLARPADDFVAQFVGADRGLKRLALFTVGDVELAQVTNGTADEPVREIRARGRAAGDRYALVLDSDRRPVGWLDLGTAHRSAASHNAAVSDNGAGSRVAASPGAASPGAASPDTASLDTASLDTASLDAPPDHAAALNNAAAATDLQPVRVVAATESLRNALSDLLATGARMGAVVDAQGAYLGVLPLETVAAVLAPPELAGRAGDARPSPYPVPAASDTGSSVAPR